MKDNHLNKKRFSGIIALVLLAVVLGYFWRNHERGKPQPTPSLNNPSKTDSATNTTTEKVPADIGAKPKVEAKDGSVKIVEEFIKLNAKNPATFEFLEWSQVSTEGNYWKVRCKYKGVSSFNAEVTTNAWFYIQNNRVVHSKIISKI